jgi:hypothetical protein
MPTRFQPRRGRQRAQATVQKQLTKGPPRLESIVREALRATRDGRTFQSRRSARREYPWQIFETQGFSSDLGHPLQALHRDEAGTVGDDCYDRKRRSSVDPSSSEKPDS